MRTLWKQAALSAAATALLALSLPGGASAEDARNGGVLRMIAHPEPPTLMLGLNQQGPTQFVAGKIYEGLLTYGPDLQPRPHLAERWEISEDGLIYTFHLRKDVRWHDGRPFTAKDVVFSATDFLAKVHPRARGHFSRADKIEALDDHTVRMTLKAPFAPFIMGFETSSAPMIPAHIYEGTDYQTNPANQTPIGTGPFKLAEWKRGAFIRLERNADYWQAGKPDLDGLNFVIVPDAASRALAFETGEVDVLRGGDIEYFDVQRLAASDGVTETRAGYEMLSPTMWVQFNLRSAPMDDARFRRAVMHAIDRQFIVDNLWFGFAKPSAGPIASTTPFYDEKALVNYDYDLKKAEALLDEMGLKKGPDGVRATVRFLPLPYGETYIRLGEYIRQQLEQIGIRTETVATDHAGWAKRLGDWDYDLSLNLLYQYGDPSLGVERAYVSTNLVKGSPSANVSGLNDPEVDRLFREAAVATDRDTRASLFSDLQQRISEQAYFGYLIEVQFPTLYRSGIENLVTGATGLNGEMEDVRLPKR